MVETYALSLVKQSPLTEPNRGACARLNTAAVPYLDDAIRKKQ